MKAITRQNLKPIFEFCLDSMDVTDKYLEEANKQSCFKRRKANKSKDFFEFTNKSFWWYATPDGFYYWIEVALQDQEYQKLNPKNFSYETK